MVRKYATFAFGLALIVALCLTMVPAHSLKSAPRFTACSNPCDPALPAFQDTTESKVVSTVDATFAVENARATARISGASRMETVLPPLPPSAPAAYPPALHRPPPFNS